MTTLDVPMSFGNVRHGVYAVYYGLNDATSDQLGKLREASSGIRADGVFDPLPAPKPREHSLKHRAKPTVQWQVRSLVREEVRNVRKRRDPYGVEDDIVGLTGSAESPRGVVRNLRSRCRCTSSPTVRFTRAVACGRSSI